MSKKKKNEKPASPKARQEQVIWTAEHGKALFELRTQLGWSQARLAKEVECTPARISELERAQVHDRPTGPSPALHARIIKVTQAHIKKNETKTKKK